MVPDNIIRGIDALFVYWSGRDVLNDHETFDQFAERNGFTEEEIDAWSAWSFGQMIHEANAREEARREGWRNN